jgi:hypothetical protein
MFLVCKVVCNHKSSWNWLKPHYEGDCFGQENVFFGVTFHIILGVVFINFHLAFWKTYKMDFDTKVSNIIFVIFQMKVIYQQNVFFQHIYDHLNENFVQMFCEIA